MLSPESVSRPRIRGARRGRRDLFAPRSADRRGSRRHAEPGADFDERSRARARRDRAAHHRPGRDGDVGFARNRANSLDLAIRALGRDRLLRREDGHLLLSSPGDGAAARGARGDPAKTRQSRDGAGLDGSRRDLPIRGEGRGGILADGSSIDPRMGHRVEAEIGSGRRRGQRLRRRAQDLRNPARRIEARRLRASDLPGLRGRRGEQRQRGRCVHRARSGAVPDPGRRPGAEPRRHRRHRRRLPERRDAHPRPRPRSGRLRADGASRRRHARRPRRGGDRRRHDADRRKPSCRGESREGTDRGNPAITPARRNDRHVLRPHRARA